MDQPRPCDRRPESAGRYKRVRVRKRRRPRRPSPAETPYTEDDVRRVSVAAHSDGAWDLALVGDGSTAYDGSCGWAVVLYDRLSKSKRTVHGSVSDGDSVECELLPYLHAVLAHARSRRRGSRRKIRVLIATDSQVAVAQWEKFKRGDRVRNASAAAVLASFPPLEGLGYSFTWRWVRKGELAANRWCDGFSRRIRRKSAAAGEPERPVESNHEHRGRRTEKNRGADQERDPVRGRREHERRGDLEPG